MSVETVARRYASALADVVMKNGETDTVKSELLQWSAMIDSNSSLREAMSNPSIAQASKAKVLENLIGKTKPSRTTSNFLRVLLRNDRLPELTPINERFVTEVEERSGIISAEVISARELPAAERSDLRSKLEKLTGKSVNLNFSIDQNIIGGMVTRVGSTVYDSSVKTQLENLKEQLVNG